MVISFVENGVCECVMSSIDPSCVCMEKFDSSVLMPDPTFQTFDSSLPNWIPRGSQRDTWQQLKSDFPYNPDEV